MDYKDNIILYVAEASSKKVSNKVILKLQKKEAEMQSGDDSNLKNLWDEICVQVQGEKSFCWEQYVDLIRNFIEDEIKSLPSEVKEAIWLQTYEGASYAENNAEDESIGYFEMDLIDYIEKYVLNEAANYTNRQIDSYLERELD